MSSTLEEMHKVCGYHYFEYSLEMLSAAVKTVVSAY